MAMASHGLVVSGAEGRAMLVHHEACGILEAKTASVQSTVQPTLLNPSGAATGIPHALWPELASQSDW